MHYLVYGKHHNGASKKQIKRIERIAVNYDYDGNRLLINRNGKVVMIPPPDERTRIVEISHLLGHFQAQTTLDRIKDKYYWKDMSKDVKSVIEKCKICIRHEVKPIINHPALALKIERIFDRIGIDLVLGLTETDSGYKGILVNTEYLTKYVYAVPIRSKTANFFNIYQCLIHQK